MLIENVKKDCAVFMCVSYFIKFKVFNVSSYFKISIISGHSKKQF